MSTSAPRTNGSTNGAGSPPADAMNQQARRIEEIVRQIDEMPNPAGRALMQECLESLLAFYGEGIERMLEVVKRSGIGGKKAYDDLLQDNVVRGLLLIHGLHPEDLATRLRQALDKVRPYMESHGGNVELLSLENDFARLRLDGSCQSCPSSAVTLELAVRHAIEELCPDLAGFEVEGAPAAADTASEKSAVEWFDLPNVPTLAEGGFAASHVDGVPIFICRANTQLYTYRDRCPACNVPLHLGRLQGSEIVCSQGHRFSITEAGRSPSDPALHLDPLPLIREKRRDQDRTRT
jgi:Fe-S cluster biogenesis protein NfuA